jgi:hypothetical protein
VVAEPEEEKEAATGSGDAAATDGGEKAAPAKTATPSGSPVAAAAPVPAIKNPGEQGRGWDGEAAVAAADCRLGVLVAPAADGSRAG